MKHTRISLFSFIIFLMLFIVISGCTSTSAQPTLTPTSEGPTGRIFTVVGPKGGNILTMDQIKALPATEGQAGIKSSTGQITIPEPFKGVSLKDIVQYLNVTLDPSMGVTVYAEDGYSMTYSYDQVMNGNFTAYDPATGNELKTHDNLTAMVAYEHNGQPLDSTSEGNLRIVVSSAKNNQVVDGHWSVKWVNKVEVKPVGQTWTLDLSGAISSPVTRDSYQSCAAPSCHGVNWEDENGQNWVGVPLWLLMGEVDDSDSHSDQAYNGELAQAGYTVDIVSSDGVTVTLNSQDIKQDNQIIIANLVNDGELPDMYYPLRLVGADVRNGDMVGKITRIHLNVPTAPTPTVAPVAENAGKIVITGLVNNELTLSDAELRSMETTTINAQGKDGPQDFTGVLLNSLLDQAGIKEGATKLVLTASDNYAVELNLADVKDCPKALLAFMDTPGAYMDVLPDQPTSTWVKNLIQIEVK
jgi:DMSO/TMAO reductase YedYZ molybdopterin-dependent catalytic subunit